MADELQFRKISDLEELEQLDGTELIPIISDGKMKAVSQGNANFGGSVTFYASSVAPAATESNYYLYKNPEMTEALTAQEAYTAVANGTVWIDAGQGAVMMVVAYVWTDSDGAATNPTDVVYVMFVCAEGQFSVGVRP